MLKKLTLSWLSITPFGLPVVPGYVREERGEEGSRGEERKRVKKAGQGGKE